ncbi:MAG: hypothetical protein MI919_24845 [Holophagales bacterium]|nr:hypothetical protein [Holophagales bacterium]
MSSLRIHLPAVALLALAAGPPSPASGGAAPESGTVELRLDSRVLVLRPSRAEIEVRRVWLQIRCLRQPDAQAEDGYSTCSGFRLGGEALEYGTLLELERVGRNRFRLERQEIHFEPGDGGHLCLAFRAVFEGVSPRDDYALYADPRDRYSFLSYCTSGELPEWARGTFPFEQNRAATLSELERRLSETIPIELKKE